MTEVGKITAVLDIDDSEFQDKLEDARGQAEDFNSEAEDLLKDIPVTADTSDLVDQIDDAISKLEALAGGDYTAKVSAETSEAGSGLDEVTQKADALSGKEADVHVKAEGAGEAKQEIESVGESLEAIKGMMETAGEVAMFAAGIESAHELAEALQEDIDKFGELQYASTATAISGGFTGEAAKTYSAQSRQLADELAIQTGRPATEIEGMINTLFGYGYTPNQINAEALTPYINMSLLPNTTPAQAAQLLALSKNTLGASPEHASDVWSKVIENSNLNAGGLAGVIPTAGMLGFPIETLGAVYKTLNQNQGLDAGSITAALKMGEMSLAGIDDVQVKVNEKTGKVTESGSGAAKALKSLGLSAADVNPQVHPLLDTLQQLHERSATLQDFKDIFGRQALPLFNLSQHLDDVRSFTDELKNSNGAAQDYASTMSDTWPEAMNRAEAATESLKTKIGGDLEPAAAQLVNFMSTSGREAAEKFIEGLETGDFSPFLQKMSEIQADVERFAADIDYTKIGINLEQGLQGAWTTAWNAVMSQANWEHIFGGLDAAGEDLMKLLGPTLEQIAIIAYNAFIGVEKAGAPAFVTLKTGFQEVQMVGSIAWNALIVGAVNLANAIGSGVVGAIKDALNALADLIDEAPSLDKISQNIANMQAGKNSDGSTPGPTNYTWNPGGPSNVTQGDKAMQELYGVQVQSEGFTAPAAPATPPGFTAPAAPAAPSSDFSGGKSGSSGGSGSSSSGGSSSGASSSSSSPTRNADWYAANGYVTDDGKTWHKPGDTGTSEAAQVTQDNTDKQQDNTKSTEDNTKSNLSLADQLRATADKINYTPINADQYTIKDANGNPIDANTKFDFNAQYQKNLAEENKRISNMELENQVNQAWLNAANALGIQMDETVQQTIGRETTDQATDQLNELGDSIMGLIPAAKAATEATNSETKAIQDNINADVARGQELIKLTAEDGEFCEAMSEFGKQQELQWDTLGLGLKSYIGPTGPQYDAFLKSEAARGAYYPETVPLGEDYSQPQKAVKYLDLDTTDADSKLQTFDNTAKEPQQATIDADNSQAIAAVEEVRANAAQGAVMPIYAQVIGGGGGSSDSGIDYGNMGLPGTPYVEDSGVFDFPHFGAGDVFVDRPTLAIVGDRPGGEWIGGADQMTARFGGQGGKIEVNYNPIINGSGLSADDLKRVLDQHGEDLMSRIWNAVQGGL